MPASRGNRVLMLVANNSYPMDPRVRREAQALTAAGYRVSVVCPAEAGQQASEVVGGVRVFRYPPYWSGGSFVGFAIEYAYATLAAFVLSLAALVRGGFDVIHAANPPDTLVLAVAPFKLLGKRFIYDHHDLAPEMYQARQGGRGSRLVYLAQVALEWLSCRLADHVIATNESYRVVEMERDGVPAERISVVRNGPELEKVRRAEPDPQLRGMGRTIIAFAGVMGPQDGVDYLLRAMRHLVYDLGRSDAYCLLIGGKGDARPALKRLATSLGLDDYVRFTDWVSDDDYVKYAASADICVVPDPSNPFADRSTMIKVVEYMALGKPVVAFDLPEHRFSAGEAAAYVRPNDERELAKVLEELMDDPERRAVMGAAGRRRVESELAWQHSVPRLLEAYRAVLPQPEGQTWSRPLAGRSQSG